VDHQYLANFIIPTKGDMPTLVYVPSCSQCLHLCPSVADSISYGTSRCWVDLKETSRDFFIPVFSQEYLGLDYGTPPIDLLQEVHYISPRAVD
jgi:hypothetical protein